VIFKIPDTVKNLSLLKTVIMKYYGTFYYNEIVNRIEDNRLKLPEGEDTKRIWPDLRLAGNNHLIRAEFGLNEKSGYEKDLLFKSPTYPCLSVIPQKIWDDYERAQKNSVSIRMGVQTKDLADSAIVKLLLDSASFKDNMDDGRERVIFALIHILKSKYKNKQDLADFLYEWYLYSSTQRPKLTDKDIYNKVSYHWNREYFITHNYLVGLIEEISGKTFKDGKLE
jgi:hypothetical protein